MARNALVRGVNFRVRRDTLFAHGVAPLPQLSTLLWPTSFVNAKGRYHSR